MQTYTVQEVINKIDLQYRNVMPNTYKIEKINEALMELYDIIGHDHTFIIQTTAGVALYAMDPALEFDQIDSFTMSAGIENPDTPDLTSHNTYEPVGIDEELRPYSYFKAEEGILAVYPAPTENGQVIRISSRSRSTSVSLVTDTVEVERENVKAIVYYVMAQIAEANDDVYKRNNFIISYDDEIARIRERMYSRAGKYPTSKVVGKMTQREIRHHRLQSRGSIVRRF